MAFRALELTLPNGRSLALGHDRFVRGLGKHVERLVERTAGSIQVCLRVRVLRIALRVELVAPGADDRRREHLPDGGE